MEIAKKDYEAAFGTLWAEDGCQKTQIADHNGVVVPTLM
jgi:hypothetical protein